MQALLLFLVYAFETTRSPASESSGADFDSSRGDYVAPDGGAFSFAPLPLPTMHTPPQPALAPLPTYI